MKTLNYSCVYLYGAQLWIAIFLFCILLIGFIVIGNCYIAAERKADKFVTKYNQAKADRQAAEWELESVKLKMRGQAGKPVTTNDKVGAEKDG